MNRRDMIIVATLMNTGLLGILFMMAIQTETQGSTEFTAAPQPADTSIVAQTSYVVEEAAAPILPHEPTVPVAKTSRHDELDKVISNFANVVPPKPIILEEDLFAEEVKSPRLNHEKENTRIGNAETGSDLVEVTVKRGDSLDKIARANKTTVKAIKRANNLSSDKLQIGQVLRIPDTANVAAAPVVEMPVVKTIAPTPKDVEYYTLKNGDNPWKIAKQFGVRFEQLLQLNGLDEAKARRLKAGDKIRVR